MDLAGTETRLENSSQHLTHELSLKEISQVLLQNWPLFLVLFLTLSMTGAGIYFWKVPYVSTASVIVNDSQNSSLQSFSSQFAGTTSVNKVNEAKKNNSPLQKHLEYLKTAEFYGKLLSRAAIRGQQATLSLAEQKGYSAFKRDILGNIFVKDMNQDQLTQVYSKIEDTLKLKITSDYELEVSSYTKNKELSLFITNVTVSLVSEVLKERELNELKKIKEFLTTQKEQTDKNLTDLNTKLADFQNKPGNLLSLSSKDKVGDYLTELMVRKNETQMKISENMKLISVLSAGRGAARESQLYGNGGRVSAIQIENEMLKSKLSQIQTAIDRVSQDAKGIPVAGQIFEDLKKKSEIEFGKYKEVSESLAKSEAYELSLVNKFEVLENARAEKSRPVVSLLTLLLVAFIVSQVLGSLIIYVSTIWNTSLVTAQQTRNVMVIDSHSIDPRVIIENSKIKFRLRHSQFDQDQEGDESKRLGFNFIQKNTDDTEGLAGQ